MKGITPIVAVVTLLLIASCISLVLYFAVIISMSNQPQYEEYWECDVWKYPDCPPQETLIETVVRENCVINCFSLIKYYDDLVDINDSGKCNIHEMICYCLNPCVTQTHKRRLIE